MFDLVENFKKKIGNILYKDRFNIIEIDNLLDENLFKDLRNNFPNEKFFSDHNEFAMTFDDENENFEQFINQNENWKNLIKQFQNKNFVEYLIKIFKINNVYYKNFWKKFIPHFKKAKLSFRFNISKSGGFSLPHTDSSRKLVSLVLFFVDDQWNIDNGGQVHFYKTKYLENENNWRNERVDAKHLKVIKTIFPTSNKIYGFKKTKNSYHSVEIVKNVNNLSRKVFMINLIYSNKSDSPYNEPISIFKEIKNFFKSLIKN